MTLSVAYKQAAIPVLWEVLNKKGNATAAQHTALIKRFVGEFGAERIQRVYARRRIRHLSVIGVSDCRRDRFSYSLKDEPQKCGRKFSEEDGKMFPSACALRGKVKIEVFGLEVLSAS